ncbi:MAG: DNA polymerase Y family protein [Brucellaceae bacterium]|nr:DNA polymerase Y family protein [Brucellaceae bacterium]
MRRYLSVWLPRWPVERRSGPRAMAQGNGLPPDGRDPLVLSSNTQSGARITAVNDAAARLGLAPGMAVADARALQPGLAVEPADEAGDALALRHLALWSRRYSPLTRTDPPDGVSIDITGCAHLFGGEAALADDLADRLHGFGLTARLAASSAIGASWALARFAPDAITLAAPGGLGDRVAPLPVAGLRLDADTLAALKRLGLERIGMLVGKPRAPLATRFGRSLVTRLDQALGLEDEPFDPLAPPPHYRAELRFAEPLVTLEAIAIAVERLAGDLAETLYRAGKAARRLQLSLYRVDGWHETLELRIASLSRDAAHLARLLCERLDTVQDRAGFGFEAAMLDAFDTEKADALQHAWTEADTADAHARAIAPLLDRLANRFGAANVIRFAPRQSYIPERAGRAVSVLDAERTDDWTAHVDAVSGATPFARPLLLFDPPEPVSVIVEMPDKPPARFEWRKISHRVTRAEGPERIAPEWWVIGDPQRKTRDYYRVEDEAGRRFWLYRDGLYERPDDAPRWFIHGLFA